MKHLRRNIFISIFILTALVMTSCFGAEESVFTPSSEINAPAMTEGNGTYAYYNNNVPNFTNIPSPISTYESYSELDGLGRCGAAEACLGLDLMPTEEREPSLSSVTPSGWKQAYYPGFVDGDYLYNRCHLIGFQLAGEQANKKNLITGTRYMNVDGMLPFENMVADYIKETGNHVMYRVTPDYAGDYDLVASGVVMEALSIEDGGDAISFSVYVYNIQPGITINYRDGSSYLSGGTPPSSDQTTDETPSIIVINKKSGVFHLPTCSGAESMSESNREEREYYEGIIDDLLNEEFKSGQSYSACGLCKPAG